jgi:hypothetical protein
VVQLYKREPQTGHGDEPRCENRISARRVCSAEDAFRGEPVPPTDSQVRWSNWYKPMYPPELTAWGLPDASHAANADQFMLDAGPDGAAVVAC